MSVSVKSLSTIEYGASPKENRSNDYWGQLCRLFMTKNLIRSSVKLGA